MTRLYRSTRDKKIFGLCGGLAETFNVDATLLRLVVVVATFFSAGTVILLYILCSLVIPKEPERPFGTFGGPYGGSYGGPYGGPYGGSFGGHTYSGSGPYGHTGHHNTSYAGTGPSAAASDRPAEASGASPDLDEMMKDVEVKALRKEIEELRAKLAKLEKGEE